MSQVKGRYKSTCAWARENVNKIFVGVCITVISAGIIGSICWVGNRVIDKVDTVIAKLDKIDSLAIDARTDKMAHAKEAIVDSTQTSGIAELRGEVNEHQKALEEFGARLFKLEITK